MGAQHVLCTIYKHKGFAEFTENLEPSLTDVKEVLTYRDSKLADYVNTMGLGEIGSLVCRTNLAIHVDGTVSPCLLLHDLGAGNINSESLEDIVDNNAKRLASLLPEDCILNLLLLFRFSKSEINSQSLNFSQWSPQTGTRERITFT